MTTMNNICKNNTRAINGGATYNYACAVCGYQSGSQIKVGSHILVKHPKQWMSNMGAMLGGVIKIVKVTSKIAKYL